MEASISVDVPRVSILMDVYEDIERTLAHHCESLSAIKSAQRYDIKHVLTLADRLSYSAFAPVGWKEGFPLHNKFPPAPQPDQMHSGVLTDYNRRFPQIDSLLLSASSGNYAASTIVADASFIEELKSSAKAIAQQATHQTEIPIEAPPEPVQEVIQHPAKKARTRMNLTFSVDDSDED